MKAGIINKIKEMQKRRQPYREERPTLQIPLPEEKRPQNRPQNTSEPVKRVIVIDLN